MSLKRHTLLVVTAAALAFLPLTLSAQEGKLELNTNFLTRGEVRYGGLTAGDDNIPDYAAFILERTLIGATYASAPLKARLTAQHSSIWGCSDGGYFNVYEAWVDLRSPKGFFAKVGRQNLSYDDQRIFGSDSWAMTARSHDALKLGYEGHGHKVHLIGAFNQNPENTNGGTFYTGGLQPYKTMQALWYHFDVPGTTLGLSALAMNVGMQGGEQGVDEKVLYQQVLGGYASWKPAGWSLEAAYYHQLGTEEHGLPIDAWMASGKVEFKPTSQFKAYGGYDYLSGDEIFAVPPKGMIGTIRHQVINGFSSLYGSHHKFYGAMDFFYVTTYVGGFTPGLQNAYIGSTWKPVERLSLDASYHFLATATKLINMKRALGHEVEFSSSFSIYKSATISAGYTFMVGTETMEKLKRTAGSRHLHWGWIMLSCSPGFLSGK